MQSQSHENIHVISQGQQSIGSSDFADVHDDDQLKSSGSFVCFPSALNRI